MSVNESFSHFSVYVFFKRITGYESFSYYCSLNLKRNIGNKLLSVFSFISTEMHHDALRIVDS